MTTITPSIGHAGDELGDLLVLPNDARYDEARIAWNLAVDQRPAAVALPGVSRRRRRRRPVRRCSAACESPPRAAATAPQHSASSATPSC